MSKGAPPQNGFCLNFLPDEKTRQPLRQRSFCVTSAVKKRTKKRAKKRVKSAAQRRVAHVAHQANYRSKNSDQVAPAVFIADREWVRLEAQRLGLTDEAFRHSLKHVLEHYRKQIPNALPALPPAKKEAISSASPVRSDLAPSSLSSRESQSPDSETAKSPLAVDSAVKNKITSDAVSSSTSLALNRPPRADALPQQDGPEAGSPGSPLARRASDSPEQRGGISSVESPAAANGTALEWEPIPEAGLAAAVDGQVLWLRSIMPSAHLPDPKLVQTVAKADAIGLIEKKRIQLLFSSPITAKKGLRRLMADM
jgi:hypothetical protein